MKELKNIKIKLLGLKMSSFDQMSESGWTTARFSPDYQKKCDTCCNSVELYNERNDVGGGNPMQIPMQTKVKTSTLKLKMFRPEQKCVFS